MLKMIEHMFTRSVETVYDVAIFSAAGVRLEQMQEGIIIMFM